ncbi:MAG: PAS domain-containing protein [Bacteroidales bacterium]|nr:PAS domain-containing protein [Bacteroidales bacterium]
MKKIVIIVLMLFCSEFVDAQYIDCGDSVKNVEFFKNEAELHKSEAVVDNSDYVLKNIFMVLFILTAFTSFAIWYVSRLKSKEYRKIIGLLNGEMKKQKFQTESFGYILNSEIVPVSLMDSSGKIAWANEAFYEFYGKDKKTFDIFSGSDQNLDKESLLNKKTAVSFFVKVKNIDEKTIGFKRTLVPLPSDSDGGKNYAVIENILD